MMASVWDDEELLKEFHRLETEGALKARDIAAILNAKYGTKLTRDAILGRRFREQHPEYYTKLAARLKRPKRPDWVGVAPVIEPVKAPVTLAPLTAQQLRRVNSRVVKPPVIPAEAPWSQPPPEGVSIMDLKARSCRWPLWPYHGPISDRYCGEQTVAGKSYCQSHLKIAYK